MSGDTKFQGPTVTEFETYRCQNRDNRSCTVDDSYVLTVSVTVLVVLMPGPSRICLCHAENCIQELCIDPDTRRTSPGRLLQRATYEEHQHRERQWLHDHEERTAIHRITSATLLNADMPDSTVHAHQGAHSYATSDGSRLNNPPGSCCLKS